MNGLKQRIIGALVLISLAVIFVPMMFDEPHDERAVRSLDIPEEPPFPEVNVPEQDESMSGVPDYRIEEVEPAPEPEPEPEPTMVEDPAMGDQPGGNVTGQGETTEPDMPVSGESGPAESAQEPTSDVTGADTSPQVEPTGAATDLSEADAGAAPDEPTTGGEGDFERSLAGAWVLQLGSFGNQDNARRLRDNVRERGYGAHLQEVVRGDQTLVRVFCGPFAEKSEAEKAKQVLDKEFGIKALVTKGEG